jgi:hypothetical protein
VNVDDLISGGAVCVAVWKYSSLLLCAMVVSATVVVDRTRLDFIVQLMTLAFKDVRMRSNIVVVMNVRDFVVALRMGISLPFYTSSRT